MNKKTGLQVVMVLIIILISLWFYLKYFTKNFEDVKETQVIEKIDENQNSTSTYIADINYVSTDVKGNKYQISAKQAEIKIENADIMFLTDVVAFIFIKDSDTVKITSLCVHKDKDKNKTIGILHIHSLLQSNIH